MREELSMFVNDNYPYGKQDLFHQAFELFDDYEIEDYDTPFMEMMDVFDNSDYATFITNFESAIKNSILSIITDHGITLTEQATLSEILIIAQGILDIQSYEDKESIVRILETDFDDEEKFSELMNLVVTLPVETIAIVIESIDQGIFTKLKDYVNGEDIDVAESIEESESSKIIIKNLKDFRTFSDFKDAIGFKIINMGFKVGSSFEIYGRYLKKFIEDFKDIDKVAKEFYVVLLMSKESYILPLSHYRKISYNYIDDLDIVTKVDIALSKLQNDFDKFKSDMVQEQNNKKEIYYFGLASSSVPSGTYSGLATGYDVVFNYQNKEFEITNKERGVKGKNIPVTITKYPAGYYTVDFTNA